MTITADTVRVAMCNMDLASLLEHARQCSSIQSDVRHIWPNIYKILKRVITSCPDYMRYAYSQMDNIAEMYYAGVRRELVKVAATASYLRAIPGDLRRIIYNCCTLCTANNNSTMYEFASLILDWNLPASITSIRFDNDHTIVYSWSNDRVVCKRNLYKFLTPDPRDKSKESYTEDELAQNHAKLHNGMVNARQILADRGYVLE